MLCGYCPEGWTLELNVCVSCGTVDTSAVRPTQIAFGILGSLFVMLVLFLIGWRYVIPGNKIHWCYDKAVETLLALLRRVVSSLSKGAEKHLPKFDSRLAIQAGKLFFGNLQVVSSFTGFKVEFPDLLKAALRGLQMFSAIFTLEIFSWPGLGCLTELEYISKLAARTLLPLLIVLLMAVPVGVAWWTRRRVDAAKPDANSRKRRVEARKNLAAVQDACWNNMFTFLFLVFPASALASMEPFSCRQIGNRWFLNADLRLDCPTAADGIFWFAVVTTLVWVVGIPLLTILSMRYHQVHTLAQRKQDRALVSAMIDRFHADTGDPSRRRLANMIGNPLKKDKRDQVALNVRTRSDEIFTHIFPEHAQCTNCAGHLLPKVPRLILRKLITMGRLHGVDHLYEHSGLKNAIRFWWQEVDENLDLSVTANELRRELHQLGLEESDADSFVRDVRHHVSLMRRKQDILIEECDVKADEFEAIVQHVLDECVPALSCLQLLVVFDFVKSEQDDMKLNADMFYENMKNVCGDAFKFTGTESLDILTAEHLHILLAHKWEKREGQADNGVMERDMLTGLEASDKIVEAISLKVDDQFAHKEAEEIYSLTARQKRTLEAVWQQCEDVRDQLGIDHGYPHLSGEKRSIGKLTQTLEFLSDQLDGVRQSLLDSNVRSHDTQHTFPDIAQQGLLGCTSIDDFKRQLVMCNSDVKEILRELVAEVGLKLNRSGVISVSALKWDGSEGPKEELVMRRFGFLINAFQVSCWYWEVVEMYRKFLLTGLMVVLFDGSAPHLAGALLITFFFIMSHLMVDPYLNTGLNEFQRLALVTQFLTIFGGLIYLLVSVIEELFETKPSQRARDASRLLELVLFSLNVLVIILYPFWTLVKYVSGSRVSLRTKVLDGFMTVASYFRSHFEQEADKASVKVKSQDEALLHAQ